MGLLDPFGGTSRHCHGLVRSAFCVIDGATRTWISGSRLHSSLKCSPRSFEVPNFDPTHTRSGIGDLGAKENKSTFPRTLITGNVGAPTGALSGEH